ncbi:hypothetical protein [Ornithinibacillus californiensis]|uniref:hypothetical protein n=1 Tax=Ornithinibacillus californiensis TaxID=161536 RepID=UPI00064D75E5|nr:hypothetical protein [Ornithinibacillus californiensis]
MNENLFALVLYANFVVFLILYSFVFQIRKMIGFQLGMNISVATGGLMGLTSGMLLIFLYPFHFTWITIISTLIGMLVGALFGALFDYQTMLTGLINGLMLGIMAPMLGSILTNQFLIMLVLEVLVCSIIIILVISIRRS